MPGKIRFLDGSRWPLLVGVSLALLAGTGCEPAPPAASPTAEVASGPVREVVLDIEGMHCEACVNAITESVTSIDGVKSITVNLDDGRATVEAAEAVPDSAMTEAIEKLGYTARTVPVGNDDAPEQPG